MNLFKKIDLEYKKACKDLAQSKVNSSEYYVVKKRQEILHSILTLAYSYTWIDREETRKKLKCFIENGFSYEALVYEYGMSKSAAYVFTSRIARRFEDDVIGRNTVNRVVKDDIDIEEFKYNRNIGNIRGLFLTEVQSLLDEGKELEGVSIKELENELKFLRSTTKAMFKNKLNKLDKGKIDHIFFILESDGYEYAEEREMIRKYLNI